MWELTVDMEFSAAHQLRNYQGRCEKLHGHNWSVRIVVRCDRLDDRGLAMDFKDLREAGRNVLESLDHSVLNEVPPFDRLNPSAENLSRYIWQELSARINAPGCRVHTITVYETAGCSATYLEDDDESPSA